MLIAGLASRRSRHCSGGVRTYVSHASLSLDERRQAEAAFAVEPDCVIVATSTLELGLDVGDLDRVIQVGAPPGVSSFVQRMGRTGRRSGTTRNCLFLATDDEELLICLALATLWFAGKVEPVEPPPRPAHLFAQQIMALTLQLGGVPRTDINVWLGDVVDAVPEVERAGIIHHMLGTGILTEDVGILSLGPIDRFDRYQTVVRGIQVDDDGIREKLIAKLNTAAAALEADKTGGAHDASAVLTAAASGREAEIRAKATTTA